MLLYFAILPIILGVFTLVGSLICLFAYSFSNDMETKRLAYPWFQRLLLLAFILLSLGIFSVMMYFHQSGHG